MREPYSPELPGVSNGKSPSAFLPAFMLYCRIRHFGELYGLLWGSLATSHRAALWAASHVAWKPPRVAARAGGASMKINLCEL